MKKEEKLDDEKVVEKKESKKKNKPRDRWMVFAVLAITVLISLGFYFVSGNKEPQGFDADTDGSRIKSGMTNEGRWPRLRN